LKDIRFYHLQRQSLGEALPKLMAKVGETGLHAVIKSEDKALIDKLDKALWEYDPESFLPHDKEGCAYPEDQAFYLTTVDENPNGSTVLVLIDAAKNTNFDEYDRCLYMFDGRSEDIVAAARNDWKAWKTNEDASYSMSYWQQKEMGGWEQKA